MRLRYRSAFVLPVLLALAAPADGIAQQGGVENAPESTRRSQQELEDAARAAERARIQRLLGSGEEVTYQDVLKDPDNIELNLRFARSQIARENIRGASATLERILLLDPNRPDVRLLYAVVLFRLDNLQDAERELLAVRDLPMRASLRAEIEGFLSQIQQRKKRIRYNALVAFGYQYDWNGNTASRSSTRLVSGFPASPGRSGHPSLRTFDQRHPAGRIRIRSRPATASQCVVDCHRLSVRARARRPA